MKTIMLCVDVCKLKFCYIIVFGDQISYSYFILYNIIMYYN